MQWWCIVLLMSVLRMLSISEQNLCLNQIRPVM